jgi:hypothetical protein
MAVRRRPCIVAAGRGRVQHIHMPRGDVDVVLFDSGEPAADCSGRIQDAGDGHRDDGPGHAQTGFGRLAKATS